MRAARLDRYGGEEVREVEDPAAEAAVEMDVARARINTIIDFAAARELGVQAQGIQAAARIENLAGLTRLIAAGKVDVEVAHTLPLEQVRQAYAEARRHTRGKIVLRM